MENQASKARAPTVAHGVNVLKTKEGTQDQKFALVELHLKALWAQVVQQINKNNYGTLFWKSPESHNMSLLDRPMVVASVPKQARSTQPV